MHKNTSRASNSKNPAPTTAPAMTGTRLDPSPLLEDVAGILFGDEFPDGPRDRGGGGELIDFDDDGGGGGDQMLLPLSIFVGGGGGELFSLEEEGGGGEESEFSGGGEDEL